MSQPIFALQSTTLRLKLSIQSGPDAGKQFQLLPPRVLIGRDPDNHIVLSDPRCSRKQCAIVIMPDQIRIEDLSSRGTTLLNSQPANMKVVLPGAKITIGDTVLLFEVEEVGLSGYAGGPLASQPAGQLSGQTPILSSVNSLADANLNPDGFKIGPSAEERIRNPQAPLFSGRLRFYTIIGVVAFAAYLFFDNKKAQKAKEPILRTEAEISKDIAKTEETTTHINEKRKYKSPEEKERALEGQRHYMEGFRDYQKGFYSRAIRSFETAIIIDPGNENARRYQASAQRERDSILFDLLNEGKQYLEKGMYTRCSAAMDKIMIELNVTTDERYKEAEALRAQCEALKSAGE